jgi:hypothetical protein
MVWMCSSQPMNERTGEVFDMVVQGKRRGEGGPHLSWLETATH